MCGIDIRVWWGERGEACLEDEWGELGFGTGEEEQDDTQGVEH
jgi:hypothetical protein